MIAKFIKFEPTKDGLTIILQADKTKDHMRELVELIGEDVYVDPIPEEPEVKVKTDKIMAIFDSLIAEIKREHDNNE